MQPALTVPGDPHGPWEPKPKVAAAARAPGVARFRVAWPATPLRSSFPLPQSTPSSSAHVRACFKRGSAGPAASLRASVREGVNASERACMQPTGSCTRGGSTDAASFFIEKTCSMARAQVVAGLPSPTQR